MRRILVTTMAMMPIAQTTKTMIERRQRCQESALLPDALAAIGRVHISKDLAK